MEEREGEGRGGGGGVMEECGEGRKDRYHQRTCRGRLLSKHTT